MSRPTNVTSPTAVADVTVVLVHGAFADASSWNGVIEGLQQRGHTVVAPPNLLRGPAADSAHIASVLGQIDAGVLSVGYAETDPPDGPAVVLLHGWPYDVHSFADVTPLLAAAATGSSCRSSAAMGPAASSRRIDRPPRPAGGRGPRRPRLDGCARDREGVPRRLGPRRPSPPPSPRSTATGRPLPAPESRYASWTPTRPC
jgi:pimeloyl-ACP methyl ester carboxylesterase